MYLLVLSPLCVAFSTLQNLNKGSARYEALLANGRMHLEYACSLAEEQIIGEVGSSSSTLGVRARGSSRG